MDAPVNTTIQCPPFSAPVMPFFDPPTLPYYSRRPRSVAKVIIITSTSAGTTAAISILPAPPTTTSLSDQGLFLLEQAVAHKDLDAFIRRVNAIDWQTRPVEDYLRSIDLALKVEAHLTARRLSQEGGERFPDHPEMAKYARILAPVKTVRTGLPPNPDLAHSMAWLRQHRLAYQGQWVAILHGELLASAATFQQLKQIVGDIKNTGILVTKV